MTENYHDKGYKRLFSHQPFFQQLIESFVTEEWVKEIDFDHCQKVDKEFISAHYKETESDIIYQVKFKNKPAYIYLLIEFQSTVSWFMALRMLNYVSNFYMDYVENNPQSRKLPPLFPLVLYNGDEKWTAETDFSQLLEQPLLLKQYTPQLHYFKIAENEYDADYLLKISNLVSTLFLLENRQDIDVIKIELLNLFEKQEDKQAISILLNWFKQLMLRGKQAENDWQELNGIYQNQDEVKSMLETTLERYGQTFFIKGEANTLLKLLKLKFNNLPAWVEEKVTTADVAQLDQWVERILTAETVDSLFKDTI